MTELFGGLLGQKYCVCVEVFAWRGFLPVFRRDCLVLVCLLTVVHLELDCISIVGVLCVENLFHGRLNGQGYHWPSTQ